MENTHPLDRPGVRSHIAAAIGVSNQAISNWKMRGVPVERCLAIDRATGGRVTRQELRPNDYWLIWPDLPPPDVAKTAQPATENVAQGV